MVIINRKVHTPAARDEKVHISDRMPYGTAVTSRRPQPATSSAIFVQPGSLRSNAS
jgi:hypothetical protein